MLASAAFGVNRARRAGALRGSGKDFTDLSLGKSRFDFGQAEAEAISGNGGRNEYDELAYSDNAVSAECKIFADSFVNFSKCGLGHASKKFGAGSSSRSRRFGPIDFL